MYPKPEPMGLAFILWGPERGFKMLEWDLRTRILALMLEGCLAHINKFPLKSLIPCTRFVSYFLGELHLSNLNFPLSQANVN